MRESLSFSYAGLFALSKSLLQVGASADVSVSGKDGARSTSLLPTASRNSVDTVIYAHTPSDHNQYIFISSRYCTSTFFSCQRLHAILAAAALKHFYVLASTTHLFNSSFCILHCDEIHSDCFLQALHVIIFLPGDKPRLILLARTLAHLHICDMSLASNPCRMLAVVPCGDLVTSVTRVWAPSVFTSHRCQRD
jgi:hypothetical protein